MREKGRRRKKKLECIGLKFLQLLRDIRTRVHGKGRMTILKLFVIEIGRNRKHEDTFQNSRKVQLYMVKLLHHYGNSCNNDLNLKYCGPQLLDLLWCFQSCVHMKNKTGSAFSLNFCFNCSSAVCPHNNWVR